MTFPWLPSGPSKPCSFLLTRSWEGTLQRKQIWGRGRLPPPGPLRLAQHCPLALPFNIYHP